MDQITTQSVIDPVALEAIAAFVQAELIAKPQLSGTITDLTSMVGPGMDKLKIPRFGSFVAETKVGAKALTAQKLDPTNDDLNLNLHEAVYTLIEDIAQLQSSVPILEEYAKRIASALLAKMDYRIYTELKNVSDTVPDHSVNFASGSTVTKADFTGAIKLLLDSNIPIEDGSLWAAFPTSQYKATLELSDFVDADKWGSGSEVVKANGALGRAYGFNIRVSSQFDKPVFYHSSAVAFARQQQLKFYDAVSVEDLGVKLAASHLYGVKQLQAGKAAVKIG